MKLQALKCTISWNTVTSHYSPKPAAEDYTSFSTTGTATVIQGHTNLRVKSTKGHAKCKQN